MAKEKTKAESTEEVKVIKPESTEKSSEKPSTTVIDGVEVGDPLLLRPVELPLVVKPADGGSWKNAAQETYAKVLNGYAYKNPKKWAVKKGVLLKQLVDLGENPDKLTVYQGLDTNLTYTNKVIQS